MKRFGAIYRTAAILLLNTIVLLALVEGCAHIGLTLRGAPTLDQQVAAFKQGMLALSYYAQQDWARAYWDEHMQAVDHWDYTPYALWRTRPYNGTHITVDGTRRRVVPGTACDDSAAPRIYTFGGSAMWGYGVPDTLTIPAQLTAILSERGITACVVNHAELAYNSTQSLITLQTLLQAGDVPDVVIFYDGSNDIATANRSGAAGSHFYFPQIDARLSGTVSGLETQDAPTLGDWLRGTASYRLIAPPPQPADTWAQPPFDPAFLDAVTSTYLANVRSAEALAESYDFTFLAAVQPTLAVIQREPSDEEQRFLWDMPGGLAELFREVYPRWQAAADADSDDALVYYGSILNDMTDLPTWIDFNHLTGWGNLAMATHLADLVQAVAR